MNIRYSILLILALILTACNLPMTATPVPPTATPLPPTATPIPPTETPIPPTATLSAPVIGWVPVYFRMFDLNTGWGCDLSGYLLRTTDGGWNWLNVTPAEIAGTGRSFAMGYYSAQALWVMPTSDDPESGRLLRTLDGGATWSAFDVPFGWAHMAVLDEQHLYALAGYGAAAGSHAAALWASEDGGGSWELVADARPDNAIPDTLPFGGSKSGVAAPDFQHVYVTGAIPMSNYSYVHASQDFGASWAQQALYIPGELAEGQNNFMPPIFFNSQSGVMFAHMYLSTGPVIGIYLTGDGGLNWIFLGYSNHPGVMAAPNTTTYFIYDGDTFSVGSMNQGGGTSWVTLVTNLPTNLWPVGLQFLDPLNGWLVAEQAGVYLIYRTSDGGNTWSLLAEAGG